MFYFIFAESILFYMQPKGIQKITIAKGNPHNDKSTDHVYCTY